MKFTWVWVLLWLAMPAFAGGNYTSYDLWPYYEQRLSYDPDGFGQKIPWHLYNGSLAEFAEHSPLDAPSTLSQTILHVNKVLKEQRHPFVFATRPNIDKAIIELIEQQYFITFNSQRSSHYGWGICLSNNYQTLLTVFEQIAQRSTMNDELLKQWLTIRIAILEHCGSEKIAQINIDPSLLSETNPARNSFLYLAGSMAFYQKQYLKAVEYFGLISVNDTTWLGQTAGYLVARSYLNYAQRYWHGYSYDKSAVNQDSLVLAVKWLQSYIHYFPNSSYIVSAQRLLRKAYWLQSDLVRYEKQIEQELMRNAEAILQGATFSRAQSVELETFIIEYQRKLKAPIKAINVLLSILNKPIYEQKNQHPFYQFLMRLQHFTKAQMLYSQKKYQQAIDELKQLKQLELKQKILMAKSLAKLGQYEQSNEIFLLLREDNLLPARQTDTQMANNLIAQGGLKQLLISDFNLNETIYQINLSRACSVGEVESLLPEIKNSEQRYHVIYELTIRYLYAGDITKLHQLLASYPDSQLRELALIKTAAKMVATNSQSAKGYMNIAYFMENKIRRPRQDNRYLSTRENSQTKCQQSVLTPQSFDPYYYYKKALELVEKPSLLEAKILHFLIYCHKPQDHTKACRWLERLSYAPALEMDRSNSSKQWFEKLHTQYKGSIWAKQTPYYY